MVSIDKQSADIAMGVDKALEAKEGDLTAVSYTHLYYYQEGQKGSRHKCYREHTAVRKHQ